MVVPFFIPALSSFKTHVNVGIIILFLKTPTLLRIFGFLLFYTLQNYFVCPLSPNFSLSFALTFDTQNKTWILT